MPFYSLQQTFGFTTVAVARVHTFKGNGQGCAHRYHNRNVSGGLASPYSIRRRGHTTIDITSKPYVNNPSRFYHHLVNDKRHIRGSATTRALLGFLPLASLLPTTSIGSKVFHRGTHDRCAPEIEELFHGNKAYIANMSETNRELLQSLANNDQKPPFMLVDCADSRVNEQEIFSAAPGTIFTTSNIANQFDEDDLTSNAVLSFAVETLRVKHVIVMGHYGCGGIAASMLPPPENEGPTPRSADLAVQNWISPIRQIYQTSNRSEIVAHRTKCPKVSQNQDIPHLHDPAFRALVEENVRANVIKIASSAVIQEHYASIAQNATIPESESDSEPVMGVYIHGWVYDIENGQVFDLGVSVGPPGKAVPPSSFPIVRPLDRDGKSAAGTWK